MATNILGLFPKEWGASTSTYYCAPTINSCWWNGLLVIPQLKTSPKLGLVGRTGPSMHKSSSETDYKMYCHTMYSQA